jgi:hypothetical protein
MDKVNDDVEFKNTVNNSEFRRLAENYAWHGAGEVSKVYEFMESLKDKDTYERMKDDLKFMIKVKPLAHRGFWLTLRHKSLEGKARTYVEMMDKSTEKERNQILSEYEFIKNNEGLGIITNEFKDEVDRIRSGSGQ